VISLVTTAPTPMTALSQIVTGRMVALLPMLKRFAEFGLAPELRSFTGLRWGALS